MDTRRGAASTGDGVRTGRRRIVRQVLRDQVKEYLIEAILTGRFKPGDRIVETRIAQELGVSQTPVREALRDLEMLGVVVSSPFRGAQVRAFTEEELVEIYPIRAAIEGVAAHAAAQRITAEQLLQLEEQIDRMRDASLSGDEATAIEADVAFHRIIVEASGNRLLQQFWVSLSLATTTYLTFTAVKRALGGLAERHEPVLEALRARDPELAEQVMRRHIEEPGRWVLEALRSAQSGGSEGER